MRYKSATHKRRWLVVNQSQSPQFQAMLESLTHKYGPVEILTGMPFTTQSDEIRTIRGPAYRRTSLSARFLSWLAFIGFATMRLLFGPAPVFLLVTTNPPFLPHLAWLYGKLRHVPYFVLFWDIYPDHAIFQGWLASGFFTEIWRCANRAATRGACAAITLGPQMAEALKSQAGNLPIEIIPNWADTEAIRPVFKQKNAFAVEHRQTGKVTILYSGNIGKTHGLSAVLKAAALLTEVPNLWFLIIGDGLGLTPAQEETKLLGVRNISFLPMQPWERLSSSLATGDIGVVVQASGTENLSVPSKVYNLMAAGCAILACTNHDSDLASLVKRYEIGEVVPPNNAARLAEAIRKMAMEPEYLKTLRQRSRSAAVEYFSAVVARQGFERVFGHALLP